MTGRPLAATRARLGAAVLTGALLAAPANAQVPFRGGPWLDVGIGYGRLRLTCATCDATGTWGTAITVSVGGAPTRNVLIGVEGQLWLRGGKGPSQRVQSLIAMVQWYPWPAAGLFLRGGTGVVRGPVAPEAAGVPPASAQGTGIGLDFGVGYDLPVSRHFGLTAQAGWNIAALGDLTVNGTTAEDVIAYVTRIGVAVVFR